MIHMATLGRRRALGQHFLRDQSVSDAIADHALKAAQTSGCRGLLEIGPGKGAITNPILDRISKFPQIESFCLAERDIDLANVWKTHAALHSLRPTSTCKMSVEEGDFLELPEDRWLKPTPLAVVSNLPYSAGTAIATRLARHYVDIPVMVLMFQAEVAQRLRADPRTKARGSLSIWIQNRWDVKLLLSVPPRAFSPPPEVNSEVVLLTRRESPRIQMDSDPKSEATLEKLLRDSFAQRRKMLRTVGSLREALAKSGVDGTKRAEALEWPEWDALYRAIRNQ
jgi:16S rRNA (adenine1518-N6/adenine1519-N6)-dimethyltransferase